MNDEIPDFRAEPDLRLTEANLAMQQQLMELTGVAQIVMQLHTGLLSLNARAYELLGLDRAAPHVTLDQLEALVHPDDLSAYYRADERSKTAKGSVDVDYRIVRPDGNVIHLRARRYVEKNAQGRAVGGVIMALDVTERKRVEGALLDTAERFRALTAISSDGHWALGPDAGTPVAAAPAPESNAAPKASSAPRRKMRVLYVEDNMFNLMLFDEVMQTREDVELRVAQDGAKGVEVAGSWFPDVLVIDANLPDIHGIQLLEQLRQIPELSKTPAFMCSGDTQAEHKIAAKEAGFIGYWTKPVDIDKVFLDLDQIADQTVFS